MAKHKLMAKLLIRIIFSISNRFSHDFVDIYFTQGLPGAPKNATQGLPGQVFDFIELI
jgi:hypothetical protein